MKRMWLVLLFFCLLLPQTTVASEDGFFFGRFGKVAIYRKSPQPSQVVIFVSGDGGWNLGVIDMAKALSALDALVAGIDITHYLKQVAASGEKCAYPAADFESLSKFLQKKYNFPAYVQPLLVGYSSGATLVYATLVQSPPNTFGGAVSMGFCPELPLTKPFCKGSGLEWKPGAKGKGCSFLPAKTLLNPWIAFQGTIDHVCDAAMVENYVRQVTNGKIVLLPKVGHGFSVQRNWLPQFIGVFRDILQQKNIGQGFRTDELKDLPLVEVPASGSGTDTMAVIISGDGGWAGIDREIADVLADQGVAVVGLNSLKYFWTSRTPADSAHALERIVRHYLTAWRKKRVLLIGYSLGADVLPFMFNGLSPEIANRVPLAAMISPGYKAVFEFHLTDWLGKASSGQTYPVLPEAKKIKGTKLLCFYGEAEEDSLCRALDNNIAKIIAIKGGHHLGGNYEYIARVILKEQ